MDSNEAKMGSDAFGAGVVGRRFDHLRRAAEIAVASVLCSASASVAQSTFTGLGVLPERDWSTVMGLSMDGLVVVGFDGTRVEMPGGYGGEYEAFRWSAATGKQGLGVLPGDVSSYAFAVNGDGSKVVGYCGGANDGVAHAQHVFVWTNGAGMELLQMPNGGTSGGGTGVSRDGSVVVGTAYVPDASSWRVSRWSDGAAPEVPVDRTAWAGALSGNGRVIVGTAEWPDGYSAFRWNGVEFTNLGVVMDGWTSAAFGASHDGAVIVGECSTHHGLRAFRWTEDGGMNDLGVLEEFGQATAHGVSHDGTIVVGDAYSALGFPSAILWTEETGMVDLNIELAERGVDLTGWRLTSAVGVARNARQVVIAGHGAHNLNQEGWLAVIPLPCGISDVAGIGGTARADGLLTIDDVVVFLSRFVSGEPKADIASIGGATGPDGLLTVDDIVVFLAAFFAGC